MYQLQGRYLQNQVKQFTPSDARCPGRSTGVRSDTDASLCRGLQGIIWPQVVTGVIGNICNAIINYIFLYYLDLGVA